MKRQVRTGFIICFVALIGLGLTAAPVSSANTYLTQTENTTSGSLSPGGSDNVEINGTLEPTDTELTISGTYSETSQSASGSVTAGGNEYIDVGGTLPVKNGYVTVDVDGSPVNANEYVGQQFAVENDDGVVVSLDVNGINSVDSITLDGSAEYPDGRNSEVTVKVPSSGTTFSGTFPDFTNVDNWGEKYIDCDYGCDTTYTGSTIDTSSSSTLEVWVEPTMFATADTTRYNLDYVKTSGGYPSVTVSSELDSKNIGSSGVADLQVPQGGQYIDFSFSAGEASYTITWTERSGTLDPSVSVGSSTVSHSGVLNGSKTEPVNIERGTEIIEANYEGSGLSYELAWNETYLSEAGQPKIEATAPANGTLIRDEVRLNASVSSPVADDIPPVTVDFYTADDEFIASGTRSGNGTVSVVHNNPKAGNNAWYAQVDGMGNATTATMNFETPSNLEIRSETDPGQLVTTANNTTVRFYAQETEQVLTRQTKDGKVQMTGLPANQAFIAVVNAEGYRNRRVLIDSLLQTQTAYLLESNKEIVEPAFRLTDFTNDYPTQDTVLLIERNFGDGWKNVEGDYFGGSNKVSAQLQYNTRYRLTVRNIETGDTYDLGSYTPTASNIIDLEVFNTGGGTTVTRAPSLEVSPAQYRLSSANESEFAFDVAENDMDLESYTIRAVRDDGFVIDSTTGTSPGADSLVLNTTEYETREIRIEYTWEAGGTGRTVNATTFLIARSFENEGALVPVLMDVGESDPSTPPGPTQSMIALVGALAGTGFAARRLGSGAAGLVGLGVLGIASLVGFFATTWLFAAAITWVVLSGLQKRI